MAGTEVLTRTYREGRRTYGLVAADALAYARDRQVIWSATDVMVGTEVDYDGDVAEGRYTDLVLVLWDVETEEVLDALGGVTIDFEVSDHGNINFDESDPWYVGLAAEMIRNQQEEAAA